MSMSLRVLAFRLAGMFVVAGFCFAAEPAKAQYYNGGCGYGCGSGSYVVAPFYGCGSCGVGFSYAPAQVVVQQVAPCAGCGAYIGHFPYYAGYRYGGYGYYGGYRYGGYGWRYGGYGWGARRWGYRW